VLECERQVSDTALPLPHRYRAGAFMSMAIGGVRWDTVQWTTAVALEKDAIVFESTREKVQGRGYHRWGAPRIGPGGTDWGAAFYAVWLQVERPSGCDWLLPAAQCPRGQRFALHMPFDLSRKATFNSALAMFRCMLRGPGLQFDMKESMRYAFHSLRAWLDTGLRQAGFSEDECTLALHWAKNSAMPRLYDRAGITSEVSIKTRLMIGYQRGWRQVTDGALPQQFQDPTAAAGQPGAMLSSATGPSSTVPTDKQAKKAAKLARKEARRAAKRTAKAIQKAAKGAKTVSAANRAARRKPKRSATAPLAAVAGPPGGEHSSATQPASELGDFATRQELYAELFPGQAWSAH